MAGPGIVLSFLIAAVASMLAGLCYAEFGCRVSQAGSAYVYTYATIGEFWGFVIGWNMILEYIIGNASLSRGLSDYIDSIFGGAIKNFFTSNIGLSFAKLPRECILLKKSLTHFLFVSSILLHSILIKLNYLVIPIRIPVDLFHLLLKSSFTMKKKCMLKVP